MAGSDDKLTETAKGPLAGVRVLDLTTVIMGPAATQILGDLGADVIKIEGPAGDSMRWVGPARHEGMGPLYLQSNRNKRSVVLDLKTKEGRDALLGLVPEADVLVYNVRPQAMKRLGLDYATVSAINPKIIFCAAVGYGSDGPNAGQAVYDDLMQAASGISGLFQAVDGAPRYAPINICDRVVGLYLTIAITSALYNRVVTGQGLTGLVRQRYGVRVGAFATSVLVVANIGTTCAEFAGIAAGFELFGVSRYVSVPLAALGVSALVIEGSFRRVQHVLLVLSAIAEPMTIISGIFWKIAIIMGFVYGWRAAKEAEQIKASFVERGSGAGVSNS